MGLNHGESFRFCQKEVTPFYTDIEVNSWSISATERKSQEYPSFYTQKLAVSVGLLTFKYATKRRHESQERHTGQKSGGSETWTARKMDLMGWTERGVVPGKEKVRRLVHGEGGPSEGIDGPRAGIWDFAETDTSPEGGTPVAD